MSAKHGSVVHAPRFSDQIYLLLREELRRGLIAPGKRVTEVELATRFGVSRTPVREALMQLRREGLILSGRARGCAIEADRNPRLNAQREEARAVIEGALAAVAARQATPAQRLALSQVYEAARAAHRAERPRDFTKSCERFLALLCSMADHKVLAQLAAALDGPERGCAELSDWRARELVRLAGLVKTVRGAAHVAKDCGLSSQRADAGR